ncbi:MAG: AAA family ATPase [Planctomycetaceae bacterium]|nr:AAA family ATPase [Planctomycetaceae bacterium]
MADKCIPKPELLRRVRDERGLSTGEVCNRTDRYLDGGSLGIRTVSRCFTKGKVEPVTVRVAVAVCKVLQIDFADGFDLIGCKVPVEYVPVKAHTHAEAVPELPVFTAKLVTETSKDVLGREEILKKIRQNLVGKNSKQAVFVTGEPGIGKTSLMMKYFAESPEDCVIHIFSRRESERSPQFALKNIVRQICEIRQSPVPEFPDSMAGLRGVFRNELRRRSAESSNTLVIVIDGTDEGDFSGLGSGTNHLGLPVTERLPGIRFLISSRDTADNVFGVRPEKISRDQPEHQKTVKRYVDSKLDWLRKQSPSWKNVERKLLRERREQILEKSQFNFMYLRCLFEELQSETTSPTDFERLPQGLECYYDDHWSRMWKVETDLNMAVLRVLVHMTSEPERLGANDWGGIPAAELRAVAGYGSEASLYSVLKRWSMFFDLHRRGGTVYYSFYHDSYRRFLSESEHLEQAIAAFGLTREDIYADIAERMTELMMEV